MRQIEFKYRKWGWTRFIRRNIPGSYAEMSPEQFLATIRLSKGWIDEKDFFLQFFGLSEKQLLKIDPFLLYKLTELMGFLKELRAVHTAFFLPSLPGKLLAPAGKLKGMSFQQFMTVDTFFSWYVTTEKGVYLDRFVAALYLKEKESYMPGADEMGVDLDARAKTVGHLPFDLKYAIMVNWVLIRSWLSRSYIHLFPEGEPAENSKGDRVKAKPVDWLSVFDAFVGDNVADMDAYKSLPCMDAFRLLNRRIKEAKKK
ncbi:MAG: hypothetical protein IJZ86_01300 [Bacteroides sp.]|nr:hypothetical protein [Bacteroides sp.]